MFFRARRAAGRAWFNFNSRAILHTSPLQQNDPGLTIVSMMCHGEVMMYLVAVKSFCHQLGRTPKVVILNDGSLTAEDRQTLDSHLPGVSIVPISSVSTDQCPKGSCWERLFLIGDMVADTYIVQLDADTITLGDISEVKECIAGNSSFSLLGDNSYPEVESMADACARYRSNTEMMVQPICERSFDQLPESADLNYVRGNAGFTGFAKGSFSRERISWLSELMRRIAHERWDDWGSEQVTSNLVIANTPGARLLPFPKYLSYWARPEVQYGKSSFIHFIGPHRFSNGMYVASAKRAIRSLLK